MVKNRACIEQLKPYIPGRPIEDVKREYGLSEVVKLASNENPYGAPASAIVAYKSALQSINLYPDGSCVELREALSRKLSVKSERLVFGAGEDELISMIAQAFIETGDEMVTAQITFGQCAAAVAIMGGKAVCVPMKDFGYDLDAILGAITSKTKLVYIVNPNNPTGTLLTDDEKISFINKVPESVMVVFDEAYEEFVDSGRFTSSVPLVESYPNLVVLKTFSKIFGLASLRVGYGVMREEYAAYIEKVRKPFNVPTPAQAAAYACVYEDEFAASVRRQNAEVKGFCYERLDEIGLSYVKSEANFILVDSGRDSMEVFDALMKRGYIVRPCVPFGLPSHVRVTIGTAEQMKGFFEAFKGVLKTAD